MNKHERIAELARHYAGHGVDPRYAGYFALFNTQKFYEAHDILEDLWLADKRGPDGDFFKGLIQLAGAFVHLQKGRLRPSAALFKLAQANLDKYPSPHQRIDMMAVSQLIERWLSALEANGFSSNPLAVFPSPQLNLFQ